MRAFLLIFAIIVSSAAHADFMDIGCADRTYDCLELPDGSVRCSWGTDLGKPHSVELRRAGAGPGYEIWRGKLTGLVQGKYPFELDVFQRREADFSVTYLTADLEVEGITITAQGERTVEARYLSTSRQFGVGVHCSSAINRTP